MAELSYENPESGEARANSDTKIRTALVKIKEGVNGKLGTTNFEAESVTNAILANAAKPFDWYTPKVIATEQSKESTSFVYMTTEDKIESVVLPENGLLVVGYSALFKSSASAAGRAAIFLGENQIKATGTPTVQEALTVTTELGRVTTTLKGLETVGSGAADVTTGQVLGGSAAVGGVVFLFAAAGTYTVGVKYKATSGTVTTKERKLWVAVLGV